MGRWVLQHKLLVVMVWVLLAAIALGLVGRIGPRLDYTYSTPGQPGYESNLKITARFGLDPAFEAMLPVLTLPPGVTMDSVEGQAIAARTFAAARHAGPLIYSDYASTHDPMFILDGGQSTWALISIPNPDYGPGLHVEGRVGPAVAAAVPPGARITLTGFSAMLSNAGPNAANLLRGMEFGALLALVTLFLVYGSALAVLPIIMAVPIICVTFLGVLGMTYLGPVSYFVEYMVVLLSLGIGIDFSLIVVVRWREEREKGLANEAAVLAAAGSAGRAVMLSGVTAAVGLGSLVVLPVPFLRSVGLGSLLIPLVAVCAAVTLLPVCLAVAGPTLDRVSLWRHKSTTYSSLWQKWAEFVLRHQWKAALVGLALVTLTSWPALSLKTGEPLIGSLSQQGPAAEAFHTLQKNAIPSAVDFPIYVMTHGGGEAVGQAVQIAQTTFGVHAVIAPDNPGFRRGEDALLTVIPDSEGSLAAGKEVLTALRQRLANLPGGAADVGGAAAEDMSFTDAVYGGFPLLLLVVSGVTWVILLVSLRSIVLALKAVVLNVVSLGSAFGFMVFFWQWGHGSALIYAMPATGAIRAWIPTVVFASLFGLSMDYEVFVLARIREEYQRSGSTPTAVIHGIARTGRLVTCAALILMVTFVSLSIDPNQIVKISATTLAFGVIMDALVIRTLLVPALVSLMGRWNWWMPARLSRRLPQRSWEH